jgi:uridylate kinase
MREGVAAPSAPAGGPDPVTVQREDDGAPLYRRVLLKLSGDAFAPPESGFGVSRQSTALLADQLRDVLTLGIEVAVVVGGGNIWRGRQAPGMDRARADYIGMLATVMNALALQDALEQIGVHTRVQTAIQMAQIAEPYIPLRAIRHLEQGRVVIFAAGMGVPFFSTDTTAAQRALEIHAEAILKGTKVDGVYDSDPATNPNARRYAALGYTDVLRDQLKVMDAAAVSLCMENDLPIVVFDLNVANNITRVALGEPVGTRIAADAERGGR